MSLDLIERVICLSSKGDRQPIERFDKWLKDSENIPAYEFNVENEKFYWKIVSSIKFKDIIDEDSTDWFLFYSENRGFMAISKQRNAAKNIVDEKVDFYITNIWILKSNIESIKVDEIPIMIWSPHQFFSPMYRIEHEFKQLVAKLKNPNVKLTQYVNRKSSPSGRIRVR